MPEGALPEIIRRYVSGESTTTELAAEFGVRSKQTIYNWILAGLGDKAYHEQITRALVNRIAEADQMMLDAEDAVAVTKAREFMKFARMDFERRRPALYGAKQFNVTVGEVSVNAGLIGDLGEMLNRVAQRTLPAPQVNTLTLDNDPDDEA